jgi:primosomal protein N' (replication factor Y)
MQVLSTFAQVVVEIPLETPLDYHIPPVLQPCCRVGQRVLVPVGNRQLLGYIVRLSNTSEVAKPRDIAQILDDVPLLTQDLLQLTQWVADYYMCPWGLVLKAAVPEGFRVRSTTIYALTPAAQQHAQSWPAGRASDILAALAEHGAQPQRELENRLAVRQLGTHLRRLVAEGFIEARPHLLPPKARQRLVPVVRLQQSPAAAQAAQQRLQCRAPTQAAVLTLLHEQDTWDLAALRAQVPGAAAAVKRLAQQGMVTITQEEQFRLVAPATGTPHDPLPLLNQAQQHALLHIEAKLAAPDGSPILLHGVTGSGKTEVYMRAIATVLRQGKAALVLVPEISLTDQLVQRFVARFPSRIAVLHSGLSAGERFDEWRRLASGDACIAIGARSAVFAPLPALGLIIVDEEHDTSYKQEETPRYNARDVAVVRAQQSQAVVVLGSATPALETFQHAKNGKYLLLTLPQRVEEKPLPGITVIDQRPRTTPNERIITTPLAQAIAACLQRGEQCLILLNRRGFAAYLQCRDCGFIPHCIRCSVSLTYHRQDRTVKCHYCDFSQAAPAACPVCQSPALRPFGLGTQQVEDALRALFPTARLGRMDRDTTRGKAAHQRILRTLGRGDIDILVGTQMIAKGHDYPNITLVGVISADATLAIPDFRAPERLFQLLTQVAGRAGRGPAAGTVFIQTFRPDHYSVSFAQHHDYGGFFDDELRRRQAMYYPPFTRLARLLLESPEAQRVQTVSAWIATVLQRHIPDKQHLVVLGPAEAPIAKMHNHYRWHFLLKATSSRLLHRCLHDALTEVAHARQQQGVRLTVDIDPLTFM